MVMGNVAIGGSTGQPNIAQGTRRSSNQTTSSTNSHPKIGSLTSQGSLKADQNVLNSLMCVIEILNFVLDVRLDFRVTAMLSSFKEKSYISNILDNFII